MDEVVVEEKRGVYHFLMRWLALEYKVCLPQYVRMQITKFDDFLESSAKGQ